MAASSPAKSNSSAADAAATATATPSSSAAAKSQRGLNKPKCIKCGNVARSRCPYQSCKNCCAKAQNPCHIHVLKGNSSLPDKPPSSGSPLFDQQSSDGSHSGGSHRIRQFSSNFSQFSNLQAPFRSRKPLTKKDAQVINEWRFLKLKEFKERKVEAESEAFNRYMHNIDLLEEIFSFNSAPEDQTQEEMCSDNTRMVDGLKLKLRSNSVRFDNFRKRIQYIVEQGLKKLGKAESATDGTVDLSDAEGAAVQPAKKMKFTAGERMAALIDVSEKLNRARNEEDVKACWEMASHIFKWNLKTAEEQNARVELCAGCLVPKWVSPVTIKQDALCRLDAQFSSLEEIENL